MESRALELALNIIFVCADTLIAFYLIYSRGARLGGAPGMLLEQVQKNKKHNTVSLIF